MNITQRPAALFDSGGTCLSKPARTVLGDGLWNRRESPRLSGTPALVSSLSPARASSCNCCWPSGAALCFSNQRDRIGGLVTLSTVARLFHFRTWWASRPECLAGGHQTSLPRRAWPADGPVRPPEKDLSLEPVSSTLCKRDPTFCPSTSFPFGVHLQLPQSGSAPPRSSGSPVLGNKGPHQGPLVQRDHWLHGRGSSLDSAH